VEELARAGTADLSTEEVGRAVLERLRQLDQVAYLRFASVYKGFADAADFARELRLLEDADAAAR
jgi:transcriptional repressor NrdR